MAEVIYVGADHAGFELKKKVILYLKELGYQVVDQGDYKHDQNDDYPDFAYKVAQAVLKNRHPGILICGTGQGMCIAANKIKGIIAAFAYDKRTAFHAKKHLNANIICFGKHDFKKIKIIIKTFLATKFSGAKRHVRRLSKIKKIERMK